MTLPPPDYLAQLESLCGRLLDSGYFDEKFNRGGGREKAIARMVTVILAGRDLGLSVMSSLQDMYVVKDTPAMLTRRKIAQVHKNAPGVIKIIQLESDATHAKYRVERWDVINPPAFVEKTYTIEDAKRQGLTKNPRWQVDPQGMCCKRAISLCLDELCPDKYGEGHVYTLEELNVVLDDNDVPVIGEDGEVQTHGDVLLREEVQEGEFEKVETQEANADGPASPEHLSSFKKAVRAFCEQSGVVAADVNAFLNARLADMGLSSSSEATALQLDVLYDQLAREYS